MRYTLLVLFSFLVLSCGGGGSDGDDDMDDIVVGNCPAPQFTENYGGRVYAFHQGGENEIECGVFRVEIAAGLSVGVVTVCVASHDDTPIGFVADVVSGTYSEIYALWVDQNDNGDVEETEINDFITGDKFLLNNGRTLVINNLFLPGYVENYFRGDCTDNVEGAKGSLGSFARGQIESVEGAEESVKSTDIEYLVNALTEVVLEEAESEND